MLDVTTGEREKAMAGDFSWVKKHHKLACHFAVWDEGANSDSQRRHMVIAQTDRQDFCFFWKCRPGMRMQPAKILQEREVQAHEASRDRRLTLIALSIAAAALLANVYLTVADRLNLWPFRP